jgi:hypothetical protein
LQKPIWKPECMKESKGMKHPEPIDRKELKNRRTARCIEHKDWKCESATKHIGNLKLLKIRLQNLASKKVVTLASVSSRWYSECRDVADKNRKAIECEIPTIAEARHTAGKANLATEELTEPKPEKAGSRKAESQSGEPGFPGM